MEDQNVVLEQRPERWRRYPIYFLLFFWTILLPLIAWIVAFIKSKSEKLTITEDQIHYQKGILRKDQVEIPKDQIKQVNVSQCFFDRMLGVGAIAITTGGDMSEIVIRGFLDPENIKEKCR